MSEMRSFRSVVLGYVLSPLFSSSLPLSFSSFSPPCFVSFLLLLLVFLLLLVTFTCSSFDSIALAKSTSLVNGIGGSYERRRVHVGEGAEEEEEGTVDMMDGRRRGREEYGSSHTKGGEGEDDDEKEKSKQRS